MEEKLVKQWISELRSGKYKQGKYRLEWGGRYCCLGVADEAVMGGAALCNNFKASGLLEEERIDLGINKRLTKESAYKWELHKYIGEELENILFVLNDKYKWVFGDIADFLEDVLLRKGN